MYLRKIIFGAALAALCALPANSQVTQTQWVWGVTSAMTSTTSTQVIAAVAGKRIYVTRMHCNNTGATATLETVQDGSGGTTLDTLAAGPTYGGDNQSGGILFITTSGNGLYVANVTTGASTQCGASGYAN